jgi:hypothetical protein
MSVTLVPHTNLNRAIPSPSSRFHVSPRSFTGTNGYYQVNLGKADIMRLRYLNLCVAKYGKRHEDGKLFCGEELQVS